MSKMIIPSFNKIKNVTDSRYSLVVLVSKRARKIVDGSAPLVNTENEKPVSIAIEEIMDKSILFGEPMSDRAYNKKIEDEKVHKLEILKNSRMKKMKDEYEENSKIEDEINDEEVNFKESMSENA
ncbi:DNA-directed RNA polymerase, omega subunit [Peptoniphilus sp. oral taxon 386 str. F0131]|nr:DNA-directed RNA polymerase, omega subunit [Peptoniphilus sp. oral taxon 386 str. F0131]